MSTSSKSTHVDFRTLGTHEVNWAAAVESSALRAMIVLGLVQLVLVLLLHWRSSSVPLIGGMTSVAALALISSIILSLLLSPLAFVRGVRHREALRSQQHMRRTYLAAVPVTVGVTLLVALLVVAGFEVVSLSFEGVMLDRPSAALILTLLAGGLAYIITRQLMLARTSALLVNLAATYLFATLYFSGVFNDNPLWWQKSFSYLGMSDSNSRYVFDIGLVFTGVLVVTWQFYFMRDFEALQAAGTITARAVTIIRWALILTGIMLALVGIVRFGISPFFNVVHDTSATGMGVILGLLMLGLRWLVPGYSRAFIDTCLAIAVLLIVSAVLKVAGVFSLVGLELAAFAVAGIWLVLFHRSTELLVAETITNA